MGQFFFNLFRSIIDLYKNMLFKENPRHEKVDLYTTGLLLNVNTFTAAGVQALHTLYRWNDGKFLKKSHPFNLRMSSI